MRGIAVRNTLTDEWKERDVRGIEDVLQYLLVKK
jgi:hypothetical protein